MLREELDRTQEQLIKLQKSFDEKSTALSQTRKTMRNIRERNAVKLSTLKSVIA